jgi:hypothetical protein
MTIVPFRRELRRGMEGQDVRALQRALKKAGYRQSDPTGHFRKPTELQTIQFQMHHGIRKERGIVRENMWNYLTPFFDGYDRYLVENLHLTPKLTDKLDKLVNVAWQYYYHRPLHYLQQRPMEDTGPLPNIDSYLDCSEFVYVCAKQAGLPDPSGYDPPYPGYGNTDSFLAHMRHISITDVRKGDLAFYANPGHVGIVVGYASRYRDYMVIEHGSEGGPDYTQMHYRDPVAFTTWRHAA